MKIISILLLITLGLTCACSSRNNSSALKALATTVNSNPKEALDSLNSLSSQHLSSDDRAFLDFLTIKATDKSFIKHTSDSSILNVLAYVADHPEVDYHTEALYYGARVYHDLGDLPTAMRYYHNTLDRLNQMNEDEKDIQFEANVMSQYARLLSKLQLYDQARYYFEKIVNLDLALNDTLNFVDDNNILGHLWINKNDYFRANELLLKSKVMVHDKPGISADISSLYLAVVKAYLNQLDSAVFLLPNTKNFKNKDDLSTLLAFSARILKKAGKTDSAASVARRLINLDSATNNRRAGYEILLDSVYIPTYPADTLIKLVKGYATIVESTLDHNQNSLALIQQAAYNYSIHDREKIKALEAKTQLQNIVILLGFGILSLIIIVFIYITKNQHTRIKLQETTRLLEEANAVLNVKVDPVEQPEIDIKKLKEDIRSEVLQKYNDPCSESFSLSLKIIESEPYVKIKEYIADNKSLSDKDSTWSELEQLVFKYYPKFKTRLNVLTEGKIAPHYMRTIILIKCNFSPSEISTIEALSISAVGSRRKTICSKILGEGSSFHYKNIDTIIRLL
ncbi:MAG: hypothetical protein HDR97_00265 [Bacteroides sp.]|nr:hypothetical protein [Bacteroides sp.]